MENNFRKQREDMVDRYQKRGYIHSEGIAEALRTVPREHFMPQNYVEHAYSDHPFPIPGDGNQTISAPYTYAMFYEALTLEIGDHFLEVGTGSGYGAALARELVGEEGKVITIENNALTFGFGKNNLEKAGYGDIKTIHGDGSKGYPKEAPYDKICITAACPEIPQPLKDQLKTPGRLVAPVGSLSAFTGQDLILMKKREGEITTEKVARVMYVPLKGEYGWK
ncbi:MAG: protein-L-isoaspartate(D-aspartate) O-methyltransferase [Thermoproteota archaeon]